MGSGGRRRRRKNKKKKEEEQKKNSNQGSKKSSKQLETVKEVPEINQENNPPSSKIQNPEKKSLKPKKNKNIFSLIKISHIQTLKTIYPFLNILYLILNVRN